MPPDDALLMSGLPSVGALTTVVFGLGFSAGFVGARAPPLLRTPNAGGFGFGFGFGGAAGGADEDDEGAERDDSADDASIAADAARISFSAECMVWNIPATNKTVSPIVPTAMRRARRWPSLAALAGPSRPHGPYGRPEAPWASNNRASGAGHAVAAPRCPRGRNARAGRSSQSGFGPRRRADGTRGRPAMLGRGFAPRAARGARWRRAGVLLADA